MLWNAAQAQRRWIHGQHTIRTNVPGNKIQIIPPSRTVDLLNNPHWVLPLRNITMRDEITPAVVIDPINPILEFSCLFYDIQLRRPKLVEPGSRPFIQTFLHISTNRESPKKFHSEWTDNGRKIADASFHRGNTCVRQCLISNEAKWIFFSCYGGEQEQTIHCFSFLQQASAPVLKLEKESRTWGFLVPVLSSRLLLEWKRKLK